MRAAQAAITMLLTKRSRLAGSASRDGA